MVVVVVFARLKTNASGALKCATCPCNHKSKQHCDPLPQEVRRFEVKMCLKHVEKIRTVLPHVELGTVSVKVTLKKLFIFSRAQRIP